MFSLSKSIVPGFFMLFLFVNGIHASEIKYPFKIKVDEKSGKTGKHYNRIQDAKTGIWYAFVPEGEYEIGSDQHQDSKKIKVKMSAYYISEEQVTSKYIIDHLKLKHAAAVKEDLKKIKKPTEKDIILSKMTNHHIYGILDLFAANIDIGLNDEQYWKLLEKAVTTFDEKNDADFTFEGKWSKENYSAMRTFLTQVDEMLDKIAKEKKPYSIADYKDAERIACIRNVRLPTEAEWEVAAQLRLKNKNSIKGLDDHVLEWCSDYYSEIHFSRKKGFENPKGPFRGYRKKTKHPQDSSVIIGQFFVNSKLKVLRGKAPDEKKFDPSTRYYSSKGRVVVLRNRKVVESKTGVRLAFTPKEESK